MEMAIKVVCVHSMVLLIVPPSTAASGVK